MSSEENEVLQAYEAFQQAMIAKDIAKLTALTSPDKTFTHMSGKKQTREEFFQEIRNGILNYYRADIRNVRIRMHQDKAVLQADTTLTAKVYGFQGSWALHSTAYYTKQNGSWIQTDRKENEYDF
ncbi:MAG: nuclear transport factor 2 family protein [Solobacterium sp.]|nr:nuclear transport factor 2 family protein [Solobacterium sp.]